MPLSVSNYVHYRPNNYGGPAAVSAVYSRSNHMIVIKT